MECSICLSTLEEPVCIPCGHIYCNECIVDHINHGTEDENEQTSNCPTCRKPFHIFAPDLALLPKKYRPFVLPSMRRIYLDNSPYQLLKTQLKDAERRIKLLEDSKSHLIRAGERHMSAAQAHAEGEKKARLELKTARDHAARASKAADHWQLTAIDLENQFSRAVHDKEVTRGKYEKSKALFRVKEEQLKTRISEVEHQLDNMLARCALEPSIVHKRKSASRASSSRNPAGSSSPCSDPDTPPAKRPKLPLPRRRFVSPATPNSPISPGDSSLRHSTSRIKNPSRLGAQFGDETNCIEHTNDDQPPSFKGRRRHSDIYRIHSSDEECC